MDCQNEDRAEKKYKLQRVVWIVIMALLLCAGTIGGYLYFKHWQEAKQQKKYEELHNRAFVTPGNIASDTPTATPAAPTDAPKVTQPPTPTPTPDPEELLVRALYEQYADCLTILPDFDILKAENEDVFAYIALPDTIIDYPILASEKEDYYLDHNLDHSTGYPGCLYIQNCNSKDLNDHLTIVYGHNMKNGTMFGCLKEYADANFRQEHPYFFIYQENRVLIYEVSVISHISTSHLLAEDYVKKDGKWVFDAFDGGEISRMLYRVREEDPGHAYIGTPEPTEEDHMMVLSTCGEGRRFIVVGRRVADMTASEVLALAPGTE